MTPIETLCTDLAVLTDLTAEEVAAALITHESSDYGVLVALIGEHVVAPNTSADIANLFDARVNIFLADAARRAYN